MILKFFNYRLLYLPPFFLSFLGDRSTLFFITAYVMLNSKLTAIFNMLLFMHHITTSNLYAKGVKDSTQMGKNEIDAYFYLFGYM